MRKIYLIFYLCAALFALSCTSHQEAELAPPPVSIQLEDQNQFIERGLAQLQLSDAEKVAQRFMLRDTKKPFTVSAATRADQMTAVRDSLGNPLMYVVNFEQGGFCVVSATKKSLPILAHGDEGFFDLEKVDQSGVCLWLEEMEYGIVHQDTLTEGERIFLNSAWREYEKGFDAADTRAYGDMNDPRYRAFSDRMGYYMSSGDAIPLANASSSGVIPSYVVSGFQNIASNMGCPPEYAIIVRVPSDEYKNVGPLLTTQWGQESPFNKGIPFIDGNRPLVGCSAVAMTQIMKYHKWPSRYDWVSMNDPNNTKTANFIYDMAYAIDTKFGIKSSSAYIKDVARELRYFGYNVTQTLGFPNIDVILNSSQPIYTTGYRLGDVGHAWVLDGARKITERQIFKLDCQISSGGQYRYEIKGDYAHYSGLVTYYTHCNWGHAGTYDAWYLGLNPTSMTTDRNYINNRNNLYAVPR